MNTPVGSPVNPAAIPQAPQMTQQAQGQIAPQIPQLGVPSLYDQVAANQFRQGQQHNMLAQSGNAHLPNLNHPHAQVTVPVPNPPPIKGRMSFDPTPEQILAEAQGRPNMGEVTPTNYQHPQVSYTPSQGQMPMVGVTPQMSPQQQALPPQMPPQALPQMPPH